jgi:hypothetical protein
MKKVAYFMIPEWNSVYKATEDCCYEKVVYAGPEIGITAKNDQEGDPLNSWDLFCYCNLNLDIIPINKKTYLSFYDNVNRKREHLISIDKYKNQDYFRDQA